MSAMRLRANLRACLACVLALTSSSVHAEAASAYLWLSHVHAKDGEVDALTRLLVDEGVRRYSGLLESGHVLEWGIATPIVTGDVEPFTHVEWITLAGWAASDEVVRALAERARSPAWTKAVASGGKVDAILHSVITGRGTPDRPGYLHLSYLQAHEPHASAAVTAQLRACARSFDELVRSGSVANYGLIARELGVTDSWSHVAWFATNRLADRDRVMRPENCTSSDDARGPRAGEVADYARVPRRDQILRIVHYRRFQGTGARGSH